MVQRKFSFHFILNFLRKKWKIIKKVSKKVLSLVTYAISFSGLVFFIFGICMKFFYYPDIGLSETFSKATNIPFPAITICSPLVLRSDLVNLKQYLADYVNESNKHKKRERDKTLVYLNISEQNYLAVKSQICEPHLDFDMIFSGIHNRSIINIVQLLHLGAPTISETFPHCGGKYNAEDCEKILRQVSTLR